MTAPLDTVAKKKGPVEESAELAAARELVRQAKEQGLSLTGPGGLLRQLTKTVLEAALDEELTGHLGHERRAPAAGVNVATGPAEDGPDGELGAMSRSKCRAIRAGSFGIRKAQSAWLQPSVRHLSQRGRPGFVPQVRSCGDEPALKRGGGG